MDKWRVKRALCGFKPAISIFEYRTSHVGDCGKAARQNNGVGINHSYGVQSRPQVLKNF